VEVDDAYLGGQRSGGKPGRGSENKVPFIAAVQTTEDGRPHLACFAAGPFAKASFEEFMAKSTVLPLTVVSDGLGCFTVTESVGAVHDRPITGGGKGSVKLEQFRAVNTVLGNLRTALSGTQLSEVRQICRPISGRSAVPLQPKIRPAHHPAAPGARCSFLAGAARGPASVC
jgi:hypothetical protein